MEYHLFNFYIKISKYRYYCSLCNHHIRHFDYSGTESAVWDLYDTIGGNHRADRCPYCNSIGRDRMVHFFLKKEKNWKDKKVLHVAPEKQLSKWIQSKGCEYLSIDKKEDCYSNRYDSCVQKADITQLEFSDNSFDIIICNHVLEHVENDNLAMIELFRVLKEYGLAIIQVPIALNLKKTIEGNSQLTEEQRFCMFGHPDHRRLYGKDFMTRLENNGFEVKLIFVKTNHLKYGIDKREPLIVCYKH